MRQHAVKSEKRCIKCNEVKPADAFYRHAYVTRTGKPSTRFQSACRDCHAIATAARKKSDEYRAQQREYSRRNAAARREYNRAYRKRRPEVQVSAALKYSYGITLDQYNAIGESQAWCCKICGKKPAQIGKKSRLHVDHCHSTGRVRGLLCHQCNVALGLVKDSRETLAAMIRYLGG